MEASILKVAVPLEIMKTLSLQEKTVKGVVKSKDYEPRFLFELKT